jgi:hypothetical protein
MQSVPDMSWQILTIQTKGGKITGVKKAKVCND